MIFFASVAKRAGTESLVELNPPLSSTLPSLFDQRAARLNSSRGDLLT